MIPSLATHGVVSGVPGCGKSRLLARLFLFRDLWYGTAAIVLDVTGQISANLIDRMSYLRREEQERLWPRVRYVDYAGRDGYVVPDPLLYRVGEEGLYEIAQRPIECWLKLSPELARNPTLGEGAIRRVGTHAFMLMAAMEPMGQADDVARLLDDPAAWEPRIKRARAQHPTLADAARYFLDVYPKLRAHDRKLETDALRLRIAPYTADGTLNAIHCGAPQGIDFDRFFAEDPGRVVLLDLHRLNGADRKRFVAQWTIQNLLEASWRRGPGKHKSATLMIDELSAIVATPSIRNEKLDDLFVELARRVARNNALSLLCSLQSLNQLSDPVADAVMDFGMHCHGPASDQQTALKIAQRFLRWDPHLVRKTEYIQHPGSRWNTGWTDERTTEYSRQDQEYMLARRLIDELPRYKFMLGVAPTEGTSAGALRRVDVEALDRGRYPDPVLVARAQSTLMRRDGVRMEEAIDVPSSKLSAPLSTPPHDGRRTPVRSVKLT